jgi:predicted nucleic acid-binding protein
MRAGTWRTEAASHIGVPDTAIAATALHLGVPLVTGNTADYARIHDVGYPLRLSNWREA